MKNTDISESTKYHLSHQGLPELCHNSECSFPLHYETEDEANLASQEHFEHIFGVIDDEKTISVINKENNSRLIINIYEIEKIIPRGNLSVVYLKDNKKILTSTSYKELSKYGGIDFID